MEEESRSKVVTVKLGKNAKRKQENSPNFKEGKGILNCLRRNSVDRLGCLCIVGSD